MKCVVKYFDVSTGEATEYVFTDVEKIDAVGGISFEGLMTITHKNQLLQIPEHKLISVIIE